GSLPVPSKSRAELVCFLDLAGVNGLIVTDYALMAYIKEKGYPLPLHISTGGTVFNWRAVKFFKDLGAANITFPRHLTIDEIRDITATMPAVDTTVFILNSRCINVDGFCTFQHGLAGKKVFPMFRNACMLPFDISIHCTEEQRARIPFVTQARMIERQKIWEKVHVDDHPCGACALYEFKKIGIGSVKVVGRGNPLERKIKDVVFLKTLLAFLNTEELSVQAFREKARSSYEKTYSRACRLPMCYYPSVMPGALSDGNAPACQ
ncbi:MAG: U32 family peptidase, partial [Pseudomonadota bacterium]